jgi:predicted nucleotidyltransferase
MWPLFDGPVGQADLRPAPQGWTVNNERSSVQSLLEELVSDLQDALGDDLIGTYLYGSHVSGGFDPGVSDLDLVTVTSRDADQLDLAGLERTHLAFAGRHPEWNDRIETVYVGLDTLRSFRTSRGRLAVISPGEPFHLRDDPVVAWVQNWYLVRETGFALFGPPATSVVPSVSWPEFVDASRRYAAEIAAKDLDDVSPGYLAYSLLTLCRARRTVETGMDGSKQEAAAWARERDPDRAWLIDAALRCRHSGGTVGFDDPVTRSAAIAFLREFAVQSSAEVG